MSWSPFGQRLQIERFIQDVMLQAGALFTRDWRIKQLESNPIFTGRNLQAQIPLIANNPFRLVWSTSKAHLDLRHPIDLRGGVARCEARAAANHENLPV